MALFRKKTSEVDGQESGGNGEAGGARGSYRSQPAKARKWFEHAKTAAMSYNYEYALSCFAHGIRLDPDLMSIHEAMYDAAVQYAQRGGKAASGKEIKGVDDGTPVGKFAAAEFAWMKDVNNAVLALKALDAAAKIGLTEYGHWAAGPTLAALRRAKKPSKSQFLTAKELFAQVGAWNEAIVSGELALQLDPNDSELAADLKDLSAQRAMDQGGYTDAGGEEGGFRKFVKDADKQRELQEEEALSGATSVEERNLLRAKRAYEETPDVPDAVSKYAQLLKKQDTLEMVEQAYQVYMQGFETIGEYRFRMAAGDIRIEQARRRVKALMAQIKSNGESADLREKLDAARLELRDLEAAEYRERVVRYPTDRTLKYQLGLVEYDLQHFTEAMECFQKAKDEPKLRVRSGHMLGRCFARENWLSDAIAEFREALQAIDPSEEERDLDIRYDLMLALLEHARAERSIELAKEAREICSTIARKNISYRDIREQRQRVETLVKDLSGDSNGDD